MDTENRIITLKLEEGEQGSVANGDICMGIFHSDKEGENATKDTDDSKGNRTFAGFYTTYFTVVEVLDTKASRFRYQLRPVSENYPRQYHPAASMHFVGYGSFTNPERQTACYETRTYQRYLIKVDGWEFERKNIAAQFGDLSNLVIHGLHMTGYSAYLNNIYMTGVINQLSADGETESRMPFYKGIWTATGKYAYYDYVTHEGSLWLCVNQAGTQSEPLAANSDWLKWVEKGKDGEDGLIPAGRWLSWKVPYKKGSVVSFGRGTYVALRETSVPPVALLKSAGRYLTSGGYYITRGDMTEHLNSDDWDIFLTAPADGKDGKDGINGADGINGQDSISVKWRGELTSHPENPENGWSYHNTRDGKSYIYQDEAWYVMTIDGVAGANGKDGQDGKSILWKGDLKQPPTNPELNWAYRDTDNGRVYIYNGSGWELMVADGSDGEDGADGQNGLSVFITYHDSETEPALPTGTGTTGGWHTDTSSKVIWMSQKVSESSATGTWGKPIRIKGEDGLDGKDGQKGADGTSVLWKGEFDSHPANPADGWAYYNTKDGKSYVYQDGSWYLMTVDGLDGIDGQNGKSIIWKGESKTAPANPEENWAYRNTTDEKVYIYNGTGWAVMVLDGDDGIDGADGKDGYSVYITYHDSETEPARPTGTGTTGGWHTDATSDVIWISQKVAESAVLGVWGSPIRIKGEAGLVNCGRWQSKNVPYQKSSLVTFARAAFVAKRETSAPPPVALLASGNKYLTSGGHYILRGTIDKYINSDDWELLVPAPEDGKDGEPGKDGKTGIQGQIIHTTEWAANFRYQNDGEEVTTMRYLDVVTLNENNTQRIFQCRKTHTSSTTNRPPNSEYWQEFNSQQPIYTPLLMADNAEIRFLQNNQLVIKKANGEITAGLSGKGSNADGIRMWAGGKEPKDASFRVDETGRMFAANAEISGKVNATSGKIGALDIYDSYLNYSKNSAQLRFGLGVAPGVSGVNNFLYIKDSSTSDKALIELNASVGLTNPFNPLSNIALQITKGALRVLPGNIVDIPGCLFSGKINDNGTAISTDQWGRGGRGNLNIKYSFAVTYNDNKYTITHNLGHLNYHINITPIMTNNLGSRYKGFFPIILE
ncbi:MAG: hypothetical protein LIP01_15680, partial [Tannerellaceae bacterium]|nr:hypothetical protein [Tannerellaceae bacterium]